MIVKLINRYSTTFWPVMELLRMDTFMSLVCYEHGNLHFRAIDTEISFYLALNCLHKHNDSLQFT